MLGKASGLLPPRSALLPLLLRLTSPPLLAAPSSLLALEGPASQAAADEPSRRLLPARMASAQGLLGK